MNKHPENPRGRRPHPADAYGVDDIPGDPSVPISVWRTARHAADPDRGVGARLAYRLVAAYTRPGDTIVDLTPGHSLAATSLRGARVHHRAWFTDHANLIVATATMADSDPDPDAVPADRQDEDEAPSLAAWFGDDLTDPDLPSDDVIPAGAGTTPAGPAGGVLAGAAGLVVATWPLHDAPTAHETRLAALLRAGTALLRPGGCLVLVVGATTADPRTRAAAPIDFGPLGDAARRASLTYLQHIVAVTADTDADRFTYYVGDEELLALAHNAGQPWSPGHLRVHADLLVFASSGGGYA